VPLGVLLKNENVIDDIVDIMDVLHKYVPKIRSTQTFDVCDQSGRLETVDVNIDHFHHILIGGDQLTTARIRGSQKVLSNSESGKERLEGLIPVIEDWHTKMTFMKVHVYYSCY
jgi:L1 cell adhesion molecule like protein